MTATYQDILAALCTDVKLLNENDLQFSFSLTTAKEAQLAYDVLVAHGFDARVYHENDLSKLYLNRSAAAPEEKLVAALAHAQTLRHILNTMQDAASADYHVTFTNTPDMGKQISIYFPSHAPTAENFRAATPTRPHTAAYTPAAAVNRGAASKTHKTHALMAAGPVVAKKSMFSGRRGIIGWLHNYFISHFAESFLAFCGMLFLAILTLSVLITSRGYLCPDLATVETNKAWYCDFSLASRNNEKK